MNKQSAIRNPQSAIVIVGGGPAGSTVAIRLAKLGFDVTLIEKETFPRHKLCGEFISPESLAHFAELGVLDRMLAAGGEIVRETRFFDRRGRSFTVPSKLLDRGGSALSLSRSTMDHILLERAREVGVLVHEGTKIAEVFVENQRLGRISVVDRHDRREDIQADLFIDATGRSRALSKMTEGKHSRSNPGRKPIAVGFKNHFEGASIEPGVCEIFFFPGGYGGLTLVENGLANLCFLMDPRAVRKVGPEPAKLVDQAVCVNEVAATALANAQPAAAWLAVSINRFGKTGATAIENLFAVGDSAAFIDPFTGSGMLMAFESSALLAAAVAKQPNEPSAIGTQYALSHEREFARRLRICSLLRRAAFLPVVPSAAIRFLAFSEYSRNYLASWTRSASTARFKAG